MRWIDKRRTEPFFLMAWTDQTHHPYTIAPDQKLIHVVPSRDGKGKPLRSYLRLVRESDAQIGRFAKSIISVTRKYPNRVVYRRLFGEARPFWRHADPSHAPWTAI